MMANIIVEILQYKLKKGTGASFHKTMQDISVPLHIVHNIDIVAYGNSLHDMDSYYLIRSFETEEKMQLELEHFYSTNDWKNGPREAIINCIEISVRSVLNLPVVAIEHLKSQTFCK